MNISPVSFGSVLIFTIDNKPRLPIPMYVKTSFENNSKLKKYALSSTVRKPDDEVDGTIYNASKDYAKKLDKRYKEELRENPQKVILTNSKFYVDPTHQEDRFFLTAATDKDEERIMKVFDNGVDYFVARFYK